MRVLIESNSRLRFSSEISVKLQNIMAESLTLEPQDSEIGLCHEYCYCGVPSTESLVCCNGKNCPIGYYHRECVRHESATASNSSAGQDPIPTLGNPAEAAEDEWFCDLCIQAELEQPNETTELETREHKEGSEPTPNSSKMTTTKTKQSKTRFGTFKKTAKELESQAVFITKGALAQLKEDPIYNDTEFGKRVINIANTIDENSNGFEEAAKCIVGDIEEIFSSAKDKVVGPMANTFILTKFHSYRTHTETNEIFQKMMGPVRATDKEEASFLQQYVLRFVLERLLKLCNTENHTGKEEATLTVHDEQVLRYVSGYVPYALVKRYRKQSSRTAKEITEFLNSWKKDDDDMTEADSFLEYTKVWITIQNRGGLFLVSDKVYSLFRAMELVTRKQLQTQALHSTHDTIKETIVKHIYGSHHVQNLWHALCTDLHEDVSTALLTTVVNYWSKIRVTAFVKSYVIMLKQSSNAKKQGKRALRKELKKKNEDG